jgi:hypothetical protein
MRSASRRQRLLIGRPGHFETVGRKPAAAMRGARTSPTLRFVLPVDLRGGVRGHAGTPCDI